MPTAMVRIGETTRQKLRELAAREQEPMHVILDKAIEEYRRKRFLEEANAAFAALRNDPDAWQSELAERASWDATLADDLREE